MASTHKSLRSGTANKRPTTAIADGQIALNTNTTSPGLFFKDSTGATIIKIGPVHVGTTAPNATPASGGSSGNSSGEVWLDTSLTPNGVKIWNGSAWVNVTPAGSTTVQGLIELATDAETQTGSDTARAVTPAGLQSKISDSTSTTSSTTIASSTAVKSAYDLANAALPKSGGIITGNLEIGTTGSLSFEGSTADAFETTIAVTNPTADRTITLPDTTGTVVTTGDTGTVTSTMILDGTIVDGDINASAAIAHSKLANITAGQVLLGNASNVPTATALSGDVTVNSSGVTAISSGVIVNADVNASAAIAGTKISPDFGSQTVVTTGVFSHPLGAAATPSITFTGDLNTGIYSPGADQVAVATNGTGRLFITSGGNVGVNTSTPSDFGATYRTFEVKGTTGGGVFRSSGDVTTVDLYAESSAGGLGVLRTLGSHPLAFHTNSVERLRITSTGALNFVGAGTAGSTQAVSFNGSAPVNSLVIDSSGRLGIGTSSPGALLNVAGGITRLTNGAKAASNTYLQLYSSDASNQMMLEFNNSTNAYWSIQSVENGISFKPLVLNPSGGNVGIGVTSPNQPLHVVGNARFTAALLWAGTGATNSYVDGGTTGILKIGSNDRDRIKINATEITFNDATSEFARIDSSGRLLVGTSTALNSNGLSGLFNVASNTLATRDATYAYFKDDASGPLLTLSKSKSNSIGTYTYPTSGDALGRINFAGANTADARFNEGCSVAAFANQTWTASAQGSYLVFSTTADGASSPTERMRITSDGSVLLNTGGNTIEITTGTVDGAYYNNSGKQLVLSRDGGGSLILRRRSSDGTIQGFYRDGTVVGTISVTTTATAYNTSSDYRLKENVTTVTDGITRLQQLKPSRFNFITDPAKTVDGFLAHEAAEVVPECVTGEKDAVDDNGNPKYQGIDQSKLVPLLTAALQEAIGEIESLKARLTAAGI